MKSVKHSIRVLLIVVLVPTIFGYSFSAGKQNVPIVKIPWLDSMLHIQNDTTYVLNFWATWCIPCVAELPSFDSLQIAYSKEKVKVLLISLDYVKKRTEQVIPFLTKERIQAEVVLLNEPNANAWINSVDTNWSGALPATLLVNNNTSFRYFLEKELNFELLDSILKTNFINR